MRIVILFLLTCFLQLCSASSLNEVDSLRLLLKKLPQNDTTRLAHLRRIAIIQQSTRLGLETAKELNKEATHFNSDKYRCYANYYISLFYINNEILDSIANYAQLAAKLAEKEKMWLTYFEVSKIIINSHIMKEEFEFSIIEASKTYKKAKELDFPDGIVTASICLANAYIGTDRITESVEILKAAYKESPKSINDFILIELQSLLCSTAHYTHNYDDLYFYLNELSNTLDKYLRNKPFSESYNAIYLFIDIYYAFYYIANKQPAEALNHLKKAEELKESPFFLAYRNNYYDAYVDYYLLQKEYDKAITAIDSSVLDLKAFMPKDYYRQLTKKANILSKTGRKTEALELYQESLHGKDSIDHILSAKQLEQIQNIHQVNKLLLEQEQIKTNQQITTLSIIIVIITLLTIFIVHALTVRRKLKESERDMRKATAMAEEGNEIKNVFLSNMSYSIRTPLNNVVGFSQLIALDPDMDEEQRKEYSVIIKKNSEILLNLVNDVLDLSRLESGMMKFNIQKYDVITFCKEAIYTAKAKEQFIRVELNSTIKEQEITTDIFRFSQLLVSLFTYPITCNEELMITLEVNIDTSGKYICFKTVGSPIASIKFATQEVTIRNEINEFFLKRFGGTYQVSPESPEGPIILFTYPLSISE